MVSPEITVSLTAVDLVVTKFLVFHSCRNPETWRIIVKVLKLERGAWRQNSLTHFILGVFLFRILVVLKHLINKVYAFKVSFALLYSTNTTLSKCACIISLLSENSSTIYSMLSK